ncbi:MAG TPA: hypothetical protein VEC39_11915 [Vicinamibacterales bacterium]|nr:hypothetical protein [Vicinamibacterales bacterium]
MRLLLVTTWLLIGAAITAGVYWSFLITPESSVISLLTSGLLLAATVLVASFVVNGAIDIWSRGLSAAGLRRAVSSIASVIPAALIVAVMWWLTTRAEQWVAMRSGQIGAIFIARLGWDDIAWLFSAIRYAAIWLRWVIGGLLALSLMAAMLSAGWSALRRPAWLRRALRPRAIAASTVWFVALIAVPWMFLLPWRPDGLPPTSAEFAFIAVKLTVSALLLAIGTSLIIYEATRSQATTVVAADS